MQHINRFHRPALPGRDDVLNAPGASIGSGSWQERRHRDERSNAPTARISSRASPSSMRPGRVPFFVIARLLHPELPLPRRGRGSSSQPRHPSGPVTRCSVDPGSRRSARLTRSDRTRRVGFDRRTPPDRDPQCDCRQGFASMRIPMAPDGGSAPLATAGTPGAGSSLPEPDRAEALANARARGHRARDNRSRKHSGPVDRRKVRLHL